MVCDRKRCYAHMCAGINKVISDLHFRINNVDGVDELM